MIKRRIILNLDDLTDEQLMLNYRDGTLAAFDVLYARHKGSLFRYFLRNLGQQSEIVNELFQDVWMKIINAKDTYRDDAKFTTYLYTVAHNRLVDYWRGQKIKYESDNVLPDVVDDGMLPDEVIDKSQYIDYLKQQIAKLPNDQRDAFLLKEEATLTLEQIASVTGVERETVKSRFRYAVKKLKQSLLSFDKSI